jgi:FixJ family two-component response regulator
VIINDLKPPESGETVHIIDDDDDLRTGLDLLLRSAGYATRLYASVSEFDAIEVSRSTGCVILDVRMPGANGLDFQEHLSQRGVHLSILMMTGHGDIPMSVRAMKAGAIDFLTKPFDEEKLLAAVAAALHRDRIRMTERNSIEDLAERFRSLSRRERQVMALVTAGRPNKQTAFELGLSEHTIKVRRGSAMAKMQARSLADFVRMAEALHLTPETLEAGRFDPEVRHSNGKAPSTGPDDYPIEKTPSSNKGSSTG